eukprot:scaffold340_cov256-Pinguiococcus_pyrenoidosus.AAC.23
MRTDDQNEAQTAGAANGKENSKNLLSPAASPHLCHVIGRWTDSRRFKARQKAVLHPSAFGRRGNTLRIRCAVELYQTSNCGRRWGGPSFSKVPSEILSLPLPPSRTCADNFWMSGAGPLDLSFR